MVDNEATITWETAAVINRITSIPRL